MSDYFTFHKTVRGYLHKVKDIPCEDFSESFSGEYGRFHIAAVADGHGAAACTRSADGSRAAVQIAKECLEDFAEKYLEEMDKTAENDTAPNDIRIYDRLAIDNNTRKIVLKQLTDTIISRWCSFVEQDLKDRPLSEEECSLAGIQPQNERNLNDSSVFEEDYEQESRLLRHIYGTTLIAALLLPDYLILLQQGDGRCDVFYDDGTVEQPIPWDERCHENVTTSMCDKDVVESFRSHVVSLKSRRVTACYLGSDGVEDSYRNMEGTHNFYRGLTCELIERGIEGFEEYLKEYLPEFSQKGSGDDVSVSGIVDIDAAKYDILQFQKKIKRYKLEEALIQYENRKMSMSRKHGILLEQKNEAETTYQEKLRQLKNVDYELCDIYEQEKYVSVQMQEAYEELEISKIYQKYIDCAKEKKELREEFSKHKKAVSLAKLELENAQNEYVKLQKPYSGYGEIYDFDSRDVVLARIHCIEKEEELDKKRIQIKNMEELLLNKERNMEELERKLRKTKEIKTYRRWDGQKKNLEEKKLQQEKKKDLLSFGIEKAKQEFENKKQEFDEYNITYQSVEDEIQRIKQVIADLEN